MLIAMPANPHYNRAEKEGAQEVHKPQSHKKHHWKKIILWVIAGLLVLGIVAWWIVFHIVLPRTPAAKKKTAETTIQNTQDLINSRNYKGAESQLQSYINSNPDTAYKRAAYMQLGAAAASSQDFKNALNYYKQAAALDTSPQIDVTTAEAYMYQMLQDKSNAITYFKKAIDLLTPTVNDDPQAQNNINSYKVQIQQLGGTP